jgi:hypothetical protein
MEIFTTVRATSWPQKLAELEVGETILADWQSKNTARDAVSKVSLKKNIRFTTRKKIENDRKFLSITRIH